MFAQSGYSRIPVFRGTLDEIIGMLHAFDLFKLEPGDPLPIRPVAVAPASRSCGDLLLDMQRERRHLAVVLDEFGGTLGIATLEDLLEELVGEIFDEHDEGVQAAAPRLGDRPRDRRTTPPPRRASGSASRCRPDRRARSAGCSPSWRAAFPTPANASPCVGLEFDVVQASPTRIERLLIRPGPALRCAALPGRAVNALDANTIEAHGRARARRTHRRVRGAGAKLDPADLADILTHLDEQERLPWCSAAARALRPGPGRDAGRSHPEMTLAALAPAQAAEIVEELEDDDAADLLGELEPESQERILSEVEDRADVESLLRYDEETAGGRMTTHLVIVRDSDTASRRSTPFASRPKKLRTSTRCSWSTRQAAGRHCCPSRTSCSVRPIGCPRLHGRRRHLRSTRPRPGRGRSAHVALQPTERPRGR